APLVHAATLASFPRDLRPRRGPSRAHPRDARERAALRRLALDRVWHRRHPVGAVGFRPSRAVRQAHRQAQEGRVVPMQDPVPARVIAVHKETSIVRGPDGVDRSAAVSVRFRFHALAPSDYPAVGDWVTLAAGDAASPAPTTAPPALP